MQVNKTRAAGVFQETEVKETQLKRQLEPNHAFFFPFPPYDIQVDLMNNMTRVMNESLIGLLESPTGTGKTLSIICSSLSWLKKYRAEKKCKTESDLESLIQQLKEIETSSDWISSHGKKVQLEDKRADLIKDRELIDWKEKRDEELKERKEKKLMSTDLKVKDINKLKRKNLNDNDEFIGDLINLEEDIEEIDPDSLFKSDETKEGLTVQPKIFYACRTHSQLKQFVCEVKKTLLSQDVRLVSLGSRANLCPNTSVNNTRNVSLINDRCIQMIRSKDKRAKKKRQEENPIFVNETEVSLKKGSDCVGKCPYLTQRGVNELKEDILSSVQDIEEVLNAGKQQDSCSFYASRAAIKEADVIVLPYNLLFHPKSRDSYGITLDKNSVVIIDEAHNLLDTITSLHSCQVTLEQMIKCFFQLTSYINKYEKRLNPDNLNFMRQLETIVKNVIKFMRASDPKSQGQVMNATEFLISASIESINLFKLMDFLDRSQLARKLFGFSCTRVSVPPKEPVKDDPSNIKPDQKKEPTIRKGGTSSLLCRIKDKKKVSSSHNVVKNDNKLLVNGTGKTADDAKIETQSVKPQSISPLYVLQDLLNCLLNPTADGVIILSTSQDFNVTLKYFLLNASDHLKDVVTNSRCIILAGGTMKPFEEYTDLLFKPMKINGLSERILTFSCGHVTPADNVLCLSMTHGVNRNLPLNYSFSSRSSKELIDETGRVISNLCKIIPHGVVVFFSSYDYLETMFSRWESTKIIEAIQANGKKVFKEPRSASMVEKVLSEYEKVNTGRTGGILLSVVGGKVSEGINFSDNMCRCVIVIGMPYGNSTSPEMKEKMSFFDRCLGQGQGRFYYENLCFKGVNQSIGRSIRHKEDYSVILLMDERYSKKDCQVRKSLPSWIGQRYMSGLDHDAAEREIKNFFSNKNK